MENLPLVFLRKLFWMLPDHRERLKCSLVCRNWRTVYEQLRPEKLFLCFDPFIPVNHSLFYTNERVDEHHFLSIRSGLQFLSSEAARRPFVSIRKLVIFRDWSWKDRDPAPKFSFRNHVNHFRSLEHLEINLISLWLEDDELDLPKLRVLSFEDCGFERKNLTVILNTPLLEAVRIWPLYSLFLENTRISNFKFLFPDQVKVGKPS